MMVIKNNLRILCVLLLGFAYAQNAFALAYSTYGSENGWQGYKNYNHDGIKMTLMFNVYDTVANPGQFTWPSSPPSMPDSDRYIYAYQIINDSSSKDIGLFNLLDKNNNPLNQLMMHSSTSKSDGSLTSVAPETCSEQGKWEWTLDGGLLSAGKNSWYLIFSSDVAPVKGSFKVEASTETEPPIPDVPEPCTLALFGIASALLAAKRGRKRRAE